MMMMMMMINRPLKGDPLGARAKNQQISCVPMGSGEAGDVRAEQVRFWMSAGTRL